MTAKTVIIYLIEVPIIIGILLISGCGMPKQPPMVKIANAELIINRAQESKAREFAPLALRYAEDNLQTATTALQNEEYEKATRFAQRAIVDAELAEAKAELEMARQATTEMRDSIEMLRQELNR
ncbi:MAG: DUF4398 domain-containing protein [Candidatus Parabeggiatoa sp. nov. 1]|nr:MAG: DUF4398 domain-containing protein [Gammaproteobacteria bacterium]